jgi:Domain of unknown function (DUF4157)
MVRRDPPAPDASKKPAAPASPAPAPSPTPDASKTDEVKLSIPWDEILKGNTTLMQVLMPGLQPPAADAGGAAPATPATPKGPTAAGASPASPAPSAPAAAPAGAAPAAPSRLSLKDFGNLSLGLRLGFPDLNSDTAPDAPPSALQQSIQTGEIINYSMTGKLPSAYQLDKGKLVGACWGLFSKYIAPDVAAKIAKGMSGKTAGGGLSYELDGVLLPDFSGAGVSFTLKFGGGKKPTPAAPAAAPGPVQPKLKVGSTTDPLEAEADRAADQVMRMPDSAAAGTLQRKCSACEEEDKKVNTKNNGQAQAEGEAPAIVGQALSSSGQALDPGTRAFFEKRFDADFSGVRIHSDSLAAQSADAVHARAYATGNHIVLGPGESASPSRLLAHELAHVVQQEGAGSGATVKREPPAPTRQNEQFAGRQLQSATLSNVASETNCPGASEASVLQRVCDSSPTCSAPIKGDSGRFGEKTELEDEAERKKTPPPPGGVPAGSPTPCNDPRHKKPATSFTSLAKGAGASVPPEISGIFIDACMGPSTGASKSTCANFTDGTPPGADPAKDCIAVKTSDEDGAAAILAKPTRSATDDQTALDAASTVTHEAQHTHFDANAAALVPAAADCDLNTLVFHGPTPAPGGRNYRVKFYLSEISAEIAEFAPYFQNFKTTGKGGALFDEERNITGAEGENIQGDIKALKCKCECDTVDKFVGQVFTDATSGWPADQTLEFQRAMTRIMPKVWPKALQKT